MSRWFIALFAVLVARDEEKQGDSGRVDPSRVGSEAFAAWLGELRALEPGCSVPAEADLRER